MKTAVSTRTRQPHLTALVLGTLMLLFGSNAFAQHFSHTYRYTGDVEIDHIPDHDEILPQAPDNLILRFSAGVSLVKLVMKNAEGKVININFRYNPVANRVFIWPLPELPKSDYYVVDWGVIDPEQKLMSGQFLFSAGPDAVLPSSLVTEEDEEHIMVPDYRLIEPGSFLGPGQ
ncbi:copper resistance CopC family protein [Pseudohongiella sp.]|uniref:CopC domain-containing protein n=1 Tax=marine sediment metagenome TaxID=412755 RepID=A0A0F9W8T0_9ZZZZ|nr:copper resistance protein CopC [Pseudohongiella sp.]